MTLEPAPGSTGGLRPGLGLADGDRGPLSSPTVHGPHCAEPAGPPKGHGVTLLPEEGHSWGTLEQSEACRGGPKAGRLYPQIPLAGKDLG